ncbi:MAG TPA: hypothetical protein VFA60_05910 [Terriglobales bacterium]|nr:hypothetical protein [Terriglobales bacterium]
MSQRSIAALILAALLVSTGCAFYSAIDQGDKSKREQATPVPLTAEPSHHLALENEYVRVFKVEVAPHATTLMHQHDRDYFWVAIGAADVTNAPAGRPEQRLHLADGEAHFSPGRFAHRAINNASTPFRNVTVEVLKPQRESAAAQGAKDKPAAAKKEDARGLEVGRGAMTEVLMVSDGVKASEVTINPGAMLPHHTHKLPHLVIAVSALHLKNEPHGGPVTEVHMRPGDIRWVPAGVSHMVTNIGNAPARFVTLEFP